MATRRNPVLFVSGVELGRVCRACPGGQWISAEVSARLKSRRLVWTYGG